MRGHRCQCPTESEAALTSHKAGKCSHKRTKLYRRRHEHYAGGSKALGNPKPGTPWRRHETYQFLYLCDDCHMPGDVAWVRHQ
jgi:hypothetical protein